MAAINTLITIFRTAFELLNLLMLSLYILEILDTISIEIHNGSFVVHLAISDSFISRVGR